MAPISSKLENKSGGNSLAKKQNEIPIVKKGFRFVQKNHHLENNEIIDRVMSEYLQNTKEIVKDSISFIPEAGLVIKPRVYYSIEHFYRETIKMYPAYIASLMQMYDNEQHGNTSDTRHLKRLMLFVIRRYFAPNLSIPLHNKCKVIPNTNDLTPIEDPRVRPFSETPWKQKERETVIDSQSFRWIKKLGKNLKNRIQRNVFSCYYTVLSLKKKDNVEQSNSWSRFLCENVGKTVSNLQ